MKGEGADAEWTMPRTRCNAVYMQRLTIPGVDLQVPARLQRIRLQALGALDCTTGPLLLLLGVCALAGDQTFFR